MQVLPFGTLPRRSGWARVADTFIRTSLAKIRHFAKRQCELGRIWAKHLVGSVQSPATAFSRVYETNAWGGENGEYYSGAGSDRQFALPYVEAVTGVVHREGATRVVDLGCGDFRVGRMLCEQLPDIHFTGVDVVPALIEHNQREYGTERVQFVTQSIEGDGVLPDGDVCLIRQVLQHMSNAEIARTLRAVTDRYTIVVITEHQPSPTKRHKANAKLGHGYGNRLLRGSSVRVDQPPFNLPHVEVLLELPYSPDGDFLQTVVVHRVEP